MAIQCRRNKQESLGAGRLHPCTRSMDPRQSLYVYYSMRDRPPIVSPSSACRTAIYFLVFICLLTVCLLFSYCLPVICLLSACLFLTVCPLFAYSSCRMPETSQIAKVFLNRFYMRHSFKAQNYYDIGTACVFIAVKFSDTYRKMRDVIKVCAGVASKKEVTEGSRVI